MSDTAIYQVLAARHWSELGDPDQKVYRKFSKEVHPDVSTDPNAIAAFQHLTVLWNGKDTLPKLNVTLSSNKGFELQRTSTGQFLYTVSSKADNDLIVRAENAYHVLSKTADPQYFPTLEGKRHSPDGRSALQLHIPDGNWWLLNDFKKLSGRDIVWIAKRVLVALILAHEAGIIHANLSPYDVLIKPDQHGVVLSGWGAQVGMGEKLVLQPHYKESLSAENVGKPGLDLRAFAVMFRGFTPQERNLSAYFGKVKDKSLAITGREALRDLEKAAELDFGKAKFNVLKDPTHPRSLHTRF